MKQSRAHLTKPKLFIELEKAPDKSRIVDSSSDILVDFLRVGQNVNVSQELIKLPQSVQEILLVEKYANVPSGLELVKDARNKSSLFEELHKKIETIPIR